MLLFILLKIGLKNDHEYYADSSPQPLYPQFTASIILRFIGLYDLFMYRQDCL